MTKKMTPLEYLNTCLPQYKYIFMTNPSVPHYEFGRWYVSEKKPSSIGVEKRIVGVCPTFIIEDEIKAVWVHDIEIDYDGEWQDSLFCREDEMLIDRYNRELKEFVSLYYDVLIKAVKKEESIFTYIKERDSVRWLCLLKMSSNDSFFCAYAVDVLRTTVSTIKNKNETQSEHLIDALFFEDANCKNALKCLEIDAAEELKQYIYNKAINNI